MDKKLGPDFSSLERASQGLLTQIDTHGLPSIQRNLTQLESVSKRLARSHPDTNTESQAYVFAARCLLAC